MKAAGIFDCTVLGAKAGSDERGPTVQITVQITSGPDAGQRATYEEVVDARSAKYAGYSMRAVGWKGGSLRTIEADCAAWIERTGGKSTVEITHLEIKKGKNAGKIWDKVNGIGRGMARELPPVRNDHLADADAALREAMGGAPPDDGYSDAPPNDEVPFLTLSTVSLGEIAKVLR